MSTLNSRFPVFISGGAGFIGSNLTLSLLNQNKSVRSIDSMLPNYGANLVNLSSCLDSPFLNLNISDLRDSVSLSYLVSGVQTIYNLAGQTSHMDSMSDPFTDLDINAKAQLSLLEVCRNLPQDVRIVFASTRQIYGRPNYLPVDEFHPLQPVDINGINKLAGEHYHLLYSKVYGIHSTVLRLTNTYGPRMRIKDARQTFLGVWIRNLLQGKPFEIWGGDQLRDYTYVDDCVKALQLAATDDVAIGQIYNLGGFGKPVTLIETAETLISAARDLDIPVSPQPFILRDYPAERRKIDIGDYYADDKKIFNQLGWTPEIDLQEGLRRTLLYFSTELEHYL